jgi:predicted transcriptional regulator
MKKLKYIKLFENLHPNEHEEDLESVHALVTSGMLDDSEIIPMLLKLNAISWENTALIEIQGESIAGKLSYRGRLQFAGKQMYFNLDKREQLSSDEVIRLAKAEAVAMGADFAWRSNNLFATLYDLQTGKDFSIEDVPTRQVMTTMLSINTSRLREDLDVSDLEKSDEYIELSKVGLTSSQVAVTVHTGYFMDDEELDYDKVEEEYADEIKNWTGSNGLKVIKGNIELNADSDNYYTTGSFTYDVMFSDQSVLTIKTFIQRSLEVVEEYSITKDNQKVDLTDIYIKFEEEGTYPDPIHDENGDLIITQPLDFVVQYSGLY